MRLHPRNLLWDGGCCYPKSCFWLSNMWFSWRYRCYQVKIRISLRHFKFWKKNNLPWNPRWNASLFGNLLCCFSFLTNENMSKMNEAPSHPEFLETIRSYRNSNEILQALNAQFVASKCFRPSNKEISEIFLRIWFVYIFSPIFFFLKSQPKSTSCCKKKHST